MMMLVWALFLSLWSSSLAINLNSYVIHEASTGFSASGTWQRQQRAVQEHMLELKIHLRQQHLEKAEDLLMAVSHPDSPDYGKHWSAEEVAQYFAPRNASTDGVMLWLHSCGIGKNQTLISPHSNKLRIQVSAAEVETLLHTELFEYKNMRTKSIGIGFEQYSIPRALQEHVDFIILIDKVRPTMQAATIVQDRRMADPPATNRTIKCDELVTPQCLRDMYGIPNNFSATHPNNSLGIVVFTWSAYREPDLDGFFKAFEPQLIGSRPEDVSISGGVRQTVANVSFFNNEANLDVSYAMALASPTRIINYQVGDMQVLGNMNTFLAALDGAYCSALDPEFDPVYPNPAPAVPPMLPAGYNATDCGTVKELPKVLSSSFVWHEEDFTPAYLRRQCMEYLKLGLQGITVIFASGDHGVGGHPPNGTCSIVGQNTDSSKRATFPCSCPWMTCVGGTQLDGEEEIAFDRVIKVSSGNETMMLRGSSAGGFSNVFPAPKYQLEHATSSGSNMSMMRGFPDLAANADAHLIVSNEKLRAVSGTSAAAPVLAAMIARVNDARMLAGKTSVGFVNPVLYARNVTKDVVEGRNYACDGSVGFESAAGWDAVTGMGSPSFGRMSELWAQLP